MGHVDRRRKRGLHRRKPCTCEGLWIARGASSWQRKRARAFRKWSGRVLVLPRTSAIRHLTRVRTRYIQDAICRSESGFWTWYDLYCERRALDLKVMNER